MNISQLSTQLDTTNTSIASVVTTAERNVISLSQLSTQLDATNSNIASITATFERNVSQLSNWLDTTNSNITSVATTLEMNISLLSTQLDSTYSNIMSVVTTVERNISILSTLLDATNSNLTSVTTTIERNVSQLSNWLDATNSKIKLVATTVEKNISQLSTWLDATNSSIASVATTTEKNITQLSTQLDATNSNITSVAITLGRNVSQLSSWLDTTNSNIMSVAINVERNISSVFIQLDEVYRFALSMQPEAIGIHCGTGLWYRVAHLDMRDPSQQCPSAWREYNTNQFRACGRPVSSVASRLSQIFPVSHQYSKVCGRVIGIQVASPDAFHSMRNINEVYMDGVSITRGSPRHHIWSYVGSYSEITTYYLNACPCDYSRAIQPQSFVGSNYYCESGNPTGHWEGQVFPNDKLWDGKQCSHEGTCCTGTNTPPWFSVTLGSPTSDDIEVRIMGSESTANEDTPIELLEIYVQ